MVRGRQAGVVRDFQSTPTVQQKLGTVGGADSSRASGAPTHTHTKHPHSKDKCMYPEWRGTCVGGAGKDIGRKGKHRGVINKDRRG